MKVPFGTVGVGDKVEDLFIDDEALYSVTEQAGANAMTDMLRAYVPVGMTVMDGTACVGGNTYSAQQHFPTVAVEQDSLRCRILRSNMAVLGATNVTYIEDDLVTMLEASALPSGVPARLGAIVIDAPWGGLDYMKSKEVELYMSERPLAKVVQLCTRWTGVVMLKVGAGWQMLTAWRCPDTCVADVGCVIGTKKLPH